MGRKNKKAMNKRRVKTRAKKQKKRQQTKRQGALQSIKHRGGIKPQFAPGYHDAPYKLMTGVDENNNPIEETINGDLLMRAVKQAFEEELVYEKANDPNSRFEIPIGTDEHGQTIHRIVSGPQLDELSKRDELWNDKDEMIDFSWVDELPVVE